MFGSRLSFDYGPLVTTRGRFGGRYGHSGPPTPDTEHSAGLPVRIALAKAPPPVVTVHRSSPAPSGLRRWRGYGGPTRAGTATLRSDEPKGLPATVCQPCGAQEPGRYRQQGPRRTERTVRTGRVACPCPLNVGLFGAGSDPPPPRNRAYQPVRGEGDTSSSSRCIMQSSRAQLLELGEWRCKKWYRRDCPPPPWGGARQGRLV